MFIYLFIFTLYFSLVKVFSLSIKDNYLLNLLNINFLIRNFYKIINVFTATSEQFNCFLK